MKDSCPQAILKFLVTWITESTMDFQLRAVTLAAVNKTKDWAIVQNAALGDKVRLGFLTYPNLTKPSLT